MILELADIRIAPGRQAEFDEAIARGVATVIAQAAGYRGHQIRKGIESPERYMLMSAPRSGLSPARPPRGSRKLGAARRFLEIERETLEHHTVQFRQGPLFAQWRAIVGPFFTAPPTVEHFTLLPTPH